MVSRPMADLLPEPEVLLNWRGQPGQSHCELEPERLVVIVAGHDMPESGEVLQEHRFNFRGESAVNKQRRYFEIQTERAVIEIGGSYPNDPVVDQDRPVTRDLPGYQK